MSVRIGLITTLNTNIGDDFIREGLCKVLREVFVGEEVEFIPINKHDPYSVFSEWHPIRAAGVAKYLPRGQRTARRFLESFLSGPARNKFSNCDLVVQCGAPVLWPGCHLCEWAGPLWHQAIGRIHATVPVLNLAAGSCYPWERQPSKIEDGKDRDFLRAIHGYCRLTTVRDSLSASLYRELGCDVSHIACSAILSSDRKQSVPDEDAFILINYMPGGGHFDFDQGVDSQIWRETIQSLIGNLKGRHKLAFLCHNKAEVEASSDLAREIPCFWPKNLNEYFEVASKAKLGIFNRMHASVCLAGMGIPSIAVGTDTRLLMVRHLGLPSFYVKDASLAKIEHEVNRLLAETEQESARLIALKEETFRTYTDIVSETISHVGNGSIGLKPALANASSHVG